MNRRILASFMLLTLFFSTFTFSSALGSDIDSGTNTENGETTTPGDDTGDGTGDGTSDGTGTGTGDSTGDGTGDGTGTGDSTGDGTGDGTGETTDPEDGEDIEITCTAENIPLSMDKNTILTSNLQGSSTIKDATLTYIIVEQPAHGTLVHSDETSANFTYTPTLDYIGEDSFTYKVNDGKTDSNIATVTITISEPASDIIPFYYMDMQEHWANYSASHLAARGLIIGEEIGSRYYFYPNREMTRADFILFLLAITESNEDAELEIPKVTFADAESTPDWLIEASKLAYAKGIIKGSADGNSLYLNAYKPLSRKEAVVMINNVLKPTNATKNLTYKDLKDIPEWAIQAVKNLTAYEIVQGNAENEFKPNRILTRAEAIELSFKLIKQLESDSMTDIK